MGAGSAAALPSSNWDSLRTKGGSIRAEEAIYATVPDTVTLRSLEHLRTAHYAVYRVYAETGKSYIARVGVTSSEDDAPVDNSGYLGTSVSSPSGQKREYEIASGFAAAGADVCEPTHYAVTAEGLDVSWLPFIDSIPVPLNASQWHRAITGLQGFKPDEEFPVFTNRSKTFKRLDEIGGTAADDLRAQYDERLQDLFDVATKWSVIHGDAHSGNAVNTGERAVLFDLDTACWAPSVWDITHLLNRAGTDGNTGYTAPELRALFPFTDTEIDAALSLRKTAALVAKTHRESAKNRSR